MALLDQQKYDDAFPVDDLIAACERIGFPVFLRSDLSSAKHSGQKAWKIESQDRLIESVCRTFEDNELKWIASETRASFYASSFRQLPVSGASLSIRNESFVRTPIGQKSLFERQIGLPEGWQEQLAELSSLPKANDMDMLQSLSRKAAKSIGHGSWSVDWAQDANGKWWLIDMATAASSWHPDCQCR